MKKIFLSLLLLTLAFPAYAATPKRVVYSIERPTALNGAPAMDYQLWSVRVDGKDDRLLDKATQPEGIRSIVEFPIDNRILVIQEHKDGSERRVILTAKGKDVTSEYPKKYFENEPQLSTRLESPDRKLVAFIKYPDVPGFPEIKPFHVYLRDQRTKVLRDYNHASFNVGSNGSIYPLAWSPDGRYLYIKNSAYEGPAGVMLWRIDTKKGTIYQYKSVNGIDTFMFAVNSQATFALGIRSRFEGMSSAPPSEIVRVDLKNDRVKVLHRSTAKVFLSPSFGSNSDTILFGESLYDANATGWGKTTIQQLNLRTGKLTQIGRVGAQIASTADGRWLVYEQRTSDKDGNTDERRFFLYDLVKGVHRLLAVDNILSHRLPLCPDSKAASASALCERQRVHIIGFLPELASDAKTKSLNTTKMIPKPSKVKDDQSVIQNPFTGESRVPVMKDICTYGSIQAACGQIDIQFNIAEGSPVRPRKQDILNLDAVLTLINKYQGRIIGQDVVGGSLLVEVKPDEKLFQLKQELEQSGYVFFVSWNMITSLLQ